MATTAGETCETTATRFCSQSATAGSTAKTLRAPTDEAKNAQANSHPREAATQPFRIPPRRAGTRFRFSFVIRISSFVISEARPVSTAASASLEQFRVSQVEVIGDFAVVLAEIDENLEIANARHIQINGPRHVGPQDFLIEQRLAVAADDEPHVPLPADLVVDS